MSELIVLTAMAAAMIAVSAFFLGYREGRKAPRRKAESKMTERFTIEREVEWEAGREYVWWTVRDHMTGYNKTLRTEDEAAEHAAELRAKYEK